MENAQQELMIKFQMFEQQIRAIQEQLQIIEQTIIELKDLNSRMDDLVGKEGQEIMASIGKGIFARAKLISEDLLVDIGGKNYVKKSIPETKKTTIIKIPKVIEERIV